MTFSPAFLVAALLLGVPSALPQASATPLRSTQPGPADPDSLSAQALTAIQRGDPVVAHQLLSAALDLSPNHPAANLSLGNLLLSERRYPEAMDRFETVLATDLRDPGARLGELHAATSLALQARRSGDANAALLCLQHAREHLPDDPTLLLDLGIQAQQMRLLPQAAEALNAALALKPSSSQPDPSITYALARVEADQGHLPAAEQHFRAYLATRPNDASAHFGLGHVLEMQQRIDDAKAEFQRSVDLQPLQTESYFQLGQIALDAGQAETAAPLFEKTLARDPHHGGALTGLGILAYRRKEFAAANTSLTAAVQSSPDYQPAHYYLGLTLARLGDKAGSERELKTATDLTNQQDSRAVPSTQPSPVPRP